MAIKLRFISVLVPIDRINESRLPGGFKGLVERQAESLGKICWYDDHLYREEAMDPGLVEMLCEHWEEQGLELTETVEGVLRWKDLCVIDYYRGLTLPCEWVSVDLCAHVAWHADHARGETVCGDGTFSQSDAVFLPKEALRHAKFEVVDPEDTQG